MIKMLKHNNTIEDPLNITCPLLFERSCDVIFILNEGKIIDCNQASIKMFGYKDKRDGYYLNMQSAFNVLDKVLEENAAIYIKQYTGNLFDFHNILPKRWRYKNLIISTQPVVLPKLWCRITGSKSNILPELWHSIERHSIDRRGAIGFK